MKTKLSMKQVEEIVRLHLESVRKTNDFSIPLIIRAATPGQFKKALALYGSEIARIKDMRENPNKYAF